MDARIPEVARTFPGTVPFDVFDYACTSGATVIGSERVARDGPGSFADTAVTDPLATVKAACAALNVRRPGFVTPYVAEVSAAMRRSLEEDGLEIAAFGSFEQEGDRVVARIAPASVRETILRVGGSADCDAVFVSCTNLRTFDVLDSAEAELGRPVVTSNQALAWHMPRTVGIRDRLSCLGRLLSTIDSPGPKPSASSPPAGCAARA